MVSDFVKLPGPVNDVEEWSGIVTVVIRVLDDYEPWRGKESYGD